MHSSDNKVCVRADTDGEGRHFMNVHKPEHATVTIQSDGSIIVNVNDSCVFRCGQPRVWSVTQHPPQVPRGV